MPLGVSKLEAIIDLILLHDVYSPNLIVTKKSNKQHKKKKSILLWVPPAATRSAYSHV